MVHNNYLKLHNINDMPRINLGIFEASNTNILPTICKEPCPGRQGSFVFLRFFGKSALIFKPLNVDMDYVF